MRLSQRVAELVAERPLLKHPFYQAWTQGTLPRAALVPYAAQYFRQVEAFPRYVSAVHSRCEDASGRQVLLENLIEEERGAQNHPALWLRFARALGLSEEEVRQTRAWPEAEALVEVFFELTQQRSYASGLCALLAYESQVPAIATAKIDGMKRFYDLDSADATAFFSVHQSADVAHSAAGAELLDETSATYEEVSEATVLARDALWSFLDGAWAAAQALGGHCA